jgi:glucose-6-phosphate isomerase
MSPKINHPFTFDILHTEKMILSEYDNHIVRRLSNMKGQYQDQEAFDARVSEDDAALYEVYEIKREEVAGELLHGLSVIHPGKVGDEYFMTKGHFHTILETAEVYICLRGEGYMVMETPEGEWAVEPFRPNSVMYVPPRWAHRSINISLTDDLVFFFVYPGNAGHDYGSIEKQGFRKLIVDRDGEPKIVDNPRWRAPGDRV